MRRRRERPREAIRPAVGYCTPAVLKRERSQLDSAYFVRRIPSRSSTTVGRQRACQAACAAASAFCSSGVRGGAARMAPLPLTLKSVAWLGGSGFPAAIAAALSAAAADAALAAFAASAACPWSIENDWADAIEMVAAVMRITPRMVRTFKAPPRTATNGNELQRGFGPGAVTQPRCYLKGVEGA